jgi:hypothetical protein
MEIPPQDITGGQHFGRSNESKFDCILRKSVKGHRPLYKCDPTPSSPIITITSQ